MIESNPYFRLPADLSNSVLIALALAAAILLKVAFDELRRKRPPRFRPYVVWPRKPRSAARPAKPFANPRPDLSDPKEQMEAIAGADFETVPLLNREEARLLPLLEQATRKYGSGHRLMAQTSLGEVLRPKSGALTEEARRRANASINSKRLDFAIIDRFGHLKAAIEYHGSGHFHATAFMRDAVKREVLRKAGVPMLEVGADESSATLDAKIRRILRPDEP